MKRRMFSLSRGSNKPVTNFPPEDPSRHYDFVDTPVQYGPDSPLIERRRLSFGSEAQLRYACMTLFHSIETGTPYQPEGAAPKRKPKRNSGHKFLHRKVSSKAKNEHGHLCVAGGGNDIAKEKYDSGVELQASQSGAQVGFKAMQGAGEDDTPKSPTADCDGITGDVGIKQFYSEEDTTPQPREDTAFGLPSPVVDAAKSSDDHVTASALEELIDQQFGGEAVEAQQETDASSMEDGCLDSNGLTVTTSNGVAGPTARSKPDVSDAQDLNAWTDPSVLRRPPSFCLPKAVARSSSKLLVKGTGLGLQEETESGPVTSTDASTDQVEPSLRREIGSRDGGLRSLWLEDKPGYDREGVAVIVDADGVERIMTAEEEKQRHLDLQRAVMEKMFTGSIGTGLSDAVCSTNLDRLLSQHGSFNPNAAPDSPPGARSENESVSGSECEPPVVRLDRNSSNTSTTKELHGSYKKKASLIRKLSVLGLGKKKTRASPAGGSLGLSRIVKAS
ncbi:hypothetical protein VTN00DRAFT_6178 [Thermoascus crustaceus]|uniref:uncharacterized protein n=1 Tax=Thermoascus crustaceus TaxID=5088 RepID=UPI003742C9BE